MCLPGSAMGCGAATPERPPATQPPCRRGRLAALLGAVALLLMSQLQGAEPVPESDQTLVIELRQRPAEEVLPALGPHLAGGRVSLSVAGNRLLLHGPTRELGVLIDLISALDVAPRMVWVTVALDDAGRDTDEADDPADAATETHYTAGGANRSSLPGDTLSTTNHWHTGRGTARRVLVRDGDWAAVALHGSAPVTGLSAQVQAIPQVAVFASDLAAPGPVQNGGFRVRPRLAGDWVTLDIAVFGSPQDPFARGSPVQTLSTTLTGRLGDWIPVGGAADPPSADPTADRVARTRSGGMSSVLLRVTPATSPMP